MYFAHSHSGKLIFTIRGHSSPVLSLALWQDEYLAVGTRGGGVFISNITSGEQLRSLTGHRRGVSAVAITKVQRYSICLLVL